MGGGREGEGEARGVGSGRLGGGVNETPPPSDWAELLQIPTATTHAYTLKEGLSSSFSNLACTRCGIGSVNIHYIEVQVRWT